MGFNDRDYSRDNHGRSAGVLNWLMTGSVPLFRVFGIDVRMHAAFLIMLALVLLLGFGPNTPWTIRLQLVGVLWGIVLLHEFGHCFGARATGGSADLITLNPLGGLAYAMAANNPFSQTVTIAAGPAVNAVISLICGVWIYLISGNVLLTPNAFGTHFPYEGWDGVYDWLWIIHATSLALLFFNLLPVFPLDGGQLLQALLWKPLGHFRAMWITVNIGIAGAILMMLWALFVRSGFGGGLMLFIGLNCLLKCIQYRTMLKHTDPYGFESASNDAGFERALRKQSRSEDRELAKRRKARERAEREEAIERQEVDQILTKVAAGGMASLSSRERKALARASDNQRRRDTDKAKQRGWR
ncbi:MAG TPA: site-2 protease family protein [Tepidisphaeraceae bacterium]|jgi:Zn-dependent protease